MNLGRFIPYKLHAEGKVSLSGTAVTFAMLTILVGITTLLISFSVLNGYKTYIRKIVYEFNGHYEIVKLNSNKPIKLDSGIYVNYKEYFPQIKKMRATNYLGGIIQHKKTVEGFILKGYDKNGLEDINQQVIKGNKLASGDNKGVLISLQMSDKLNLKIGEKFIANFYDGSLKHKKLEVKGIFQTNLTDFDDKLVIGNLLLVNDFFGWSENESSRIEVVLKDGVNADEYFHPFMESIGIDLDVVSSHDKYIHLFAWLMNLDQNVQVLMFIIFVLVLFSIISTMYILVFEKNQLVGVLKTLGASNEQILSVFRRLGLRIAAVGLLFGNILSIGLMILQREFKLITLNPEHYYLNYMPVEINWSSIFIVNVISIVIVLLILSIPYFVIVKMRPVENLRFS